MSYIKTTLNEFINENKELSNDFWSWFGGSKIIEDGKPIVCYHGSDSKDINIFDNKKIGYNSGNRGHYGFGFYFSTDIREAKIYGSKIYEVYLKIENPFTGTDTQLLELKKNGIDTVSDEIDLSINFNSFKEALKDNKGLYEFLDNYQKYGYKKAWKEILDDNKHNVNLDNLNNFADIIEYTDLGGNESGIPDYIHDMLEELNISVKFNRGFEYEQPLHWITDLGNRSEDVTKIIKKLGYDGVWYGSELIAFESNQIKSIYNKTFDGNNSNIHK